MAQTASSDAIDVSVAPDRASLLPSPPSSSVDEVASTRSSPSGSSTSAPSTSPFFFSSKMDHGSAPLSYDLLKEITNDFSEKHLLGTGNYGRVYKGVHKDGKIIAVKLLHDMLALDDEQFMRELNNLTSLQHDNIIRLVGYCHEAQQEYVKYKGRMVVADRIHRALCFEYAHNGSLHDNLSDEHSGHDWRTRYVIIKGICNGLNYLHHELEPPMYHLDLKPANVLLDKNMLPKVADFGLSRLFGDEQTTITRSSLGTPGYLPPEFIEQHVISNKFDIFSLGVIIIKVMAGPDGYSRCADMSSREFVKLVHRNWKDRLHHEQSMNELAPYYEQVKTCIEIALMCVEANRYKRPKIGDIIAMLNKSETKIRSSSAIKNKSLLASRYLHGPTGITGLRRFEYSELAAATDSFSMDSTLGRNFFCTIYKGSYTDENGKQEVAVKKIRHSISEAEDFLPEIQTISRTRHRNVVELKGWCCSRKTSNLIDFMGWFRLQTAQVCLVYELVPNGNLDDHLHSREEILPWEKRYQIVKGIGSALRYLHHECNEPILHRDIQPSKVLLDYDFNVKLGGFGLSRIASQNDGTRMTYAIGTIGYIDPHIMKDGLVEYNRKTDVYSFGIVLLEVACGHKPREQFWEQYRCSATQPEVMEDAADPKLSGIFDRTEMERVIVLGLRCSHPNAKHRPYMLEAMQFLEAGIELPALPL